MTTPITVRATRYQSGPYGTADKGETYVVPSRKEADKLVALGIVTIVEEAPAADAPAKK